MNLAKLFGLNVAWYRKAHSLSQEELAHRAQIHRTYISDIERGARNPTLSVVAKIAEGLKVGPHLLLSPREMGGLADKPQLPPSDK